MCRYIWGNESVGDSHLYQQMHVTFVVSWCSALASSPAPDHSVHGLYIVLHLGALTVAPPSVVPNMVSKIRGIRRQLFVERLTIPGPPGPWPRFCCLTCAAHDMFQPFLDPVGIKRPLGLPA